MHDGLLACYVARPRFARGDSQDGAGARSGGGNPGARFVVKVAGSRSVPRSVHRRWLREPVGSFHHGLPARSGPAPMPAEMERLEVN